VFLSWVLIVDWVESNTELELGRGLKKKVQDPFTRKDWYGIKVSSASTKGRWASY